MNHKPSSNVRSTADMMMLAMSTTMLRRGMATELDGVGVTTGTECWSELLVCVPLVIRGTVSRFQVDGVIWRTVTKTQQQNITQIVALLFDALESLLPVTSFYQMNNAHEHDSSVQSSQQM